MKYIYYAILGILTVIVVGLLVKYTRRAPVGPDSTTWALGIFYLGGLILIILLSLLLFYFKKPGIALVIICSPLILMALTTVISGSIDVYAWFPSFSKVKPLNIVVNNDTKYPVHLKMEILFSTLVSSDQTVYKTLDYYVNASTKKSIPLSTSETQLLSKKASSVNVFVYTQKIINVDGKYTVKSDMDSYVYLGEKPDAFANGEYLLNVTELFKKQNKALGH